MLNLFTYYDGGIYLIFNRATNKSYLGSTTRKFSDRWNTHRSKLRSGTHPNKKLQASWNKWGEANFSFMVLERCAPEDCLSKEQFWLDTAEMTVYGYNLSSTAGSCTGMRHTDEAKAKIAAASKRCWENPEYRNIVISRNLGRKRSSEFCQKMKIVKNTPKAKEHMARLGRMRKGIPLSPEHKKILADASAKGRLFRSIRRMLLCHAYSNRAEEILHRLRKELGYAGKD